MRDETQALCIGSKESLATEPPGKSQKTYSFDSLVCSFIRQILRAHMLGTVLGVKYTSLNKTVFPLVELNFRWREMDSNNT